VSSVIPARRRAEKFHSLVEGTRSPGADSPASWTPLLELVGDLRGVAGPAPRPEFVADLRAALMAEADEVLLHLERELTLPAAHPGQRRQRRRLAVAAGALAFVGATASISVAAQTALPGETLYPVKRALENAQTGLYTGDAKTEEILGNASVRLDEVSQLAEEGTTQSDAQVPGTLQDFTEQAQEGATRALDSGDEEQITELRDFAADSMRTLEELDSVVPESARDELAAAARLVSRIDQQARAACPTCGGAVLDVPQIFLTSASESGGTVAPGKSATPSTTHQGDGPDGGSPSSQPSSGPSVGLPGGDDTTAPDPGSTPTPGLPTQTTGSNDPIGDALDDLLGDTDTATSDPLEPISSPLASSVDDALDDVDGLLGGG